MKSKSKQLCENVENLFNQDNYNEIINILTDEVLEKEKNAKLYAWRARANNCLDLDVEKTMYFANLAIETDPNYYMGYFIIACAWDEKKEVNKSIANYSKAIELNPKFADAYYNRGLALLNVKEKSKAILDFDNAIKYYFKEIKSKQNDLEKYVWIGNAYYYKEKYNDAIANYTKAIDSKIQHTDSILYNRALAHFALKNYPSAIKDYTKAIQFKSNFKDSYYLNRGNAWKAIKDYKKAIKDYTNAIRINPNLENAFYLRGLARKENTDKSEKIKKDFENYLKLTSEINNENEVWCKYANRYINELKINKDTKLTVIINLISKIKEILHLDATHITHYTSLSVLKSLIIDNSKFRISEGNFINDTSEGSKFGSVI